MAYKAPKINVEDLVKFPKVSTLLETLPQPFIDDNGAGVVYTGYAPLGVAEDENGWRIVKKTTAATITKALYPDGSDEFKFNWTDRASYTYSR